jgi:hypothetical protein
MYIKHELFKMLKSNHIYIVCSGNLKNENIHVKPLFYFKIEEFSFILKINNFIFENKRQIGLFIRVTVLQFIEKQAVIVFCV